MGLRLTAHRGVASQAPENTLAAIARAAELHVPWVELDAQLAADGTAVVFHDDTLERCTDGYGALWQQSYEALARLDAGEWFAERFAGERIPTLQAALSLARVRGLALNIEIKLARAQWRERQVRTIVERIADSGMPAEATLLSSFDRSALALAKDCAPQISRGLICEKVPPDIDDAVEALGLSTVHPRHDRLTAADATRIGAAGSAIHVWTLNDPDRLAGLLALGIAGVITDRPQDFTTLV